MWRRCNPRVTTGVNCVAHTAGFGSLRPETLALQSTVQIIMQEPQVLESQIHLREPARPCVFYILMWQPPTKTGVNCRAQGIKSLGVAPLERGHCSPRADWAGLRIVGTSCATLAPEVNDL